MENQTKRERNMTWKLPMTLGGILQGLLRDYVGMQALGFRVLGVDVTHNNGE